MYVRGYQGQVSGSPITDGIEAGVEVTPGFPMDYYDTYNYRLIPVFEVEWLDIDEDFVTQRYEGVRIAQSIYITPGKSEDIIRTKDNPKECKLSLNGIFFINRDTKPYSLVIACMNLQDKYDITTYFRDNIIANSGTKGDWVDISMLPISLGHNITERLMKFNAYKKAGMAPIDTSQEGRAFNNNTSFAGYDDSLKTDVIQAFELALERIENQTSQITGVFRERLGGIQQRDAVSNVQVSYNNSFTITKVYYQQMDMITTDMLLGCLDMAKIVWKKGLTGTLVLGDKYQKIFTALPEHFTVTDHEINIDVSSKLMGDIKTIQQAVFEFIKGG